MIRSVWLRSAAARVAPSAVLLGLAVAGCSEPPPAEPKLDAEAIVVGAGLSGLSAAVEMGRAGVRVLVIDMNSVAGGHAVLAGGVALVGTPVQEAAGVHDTPEQAYKDWMRWTEDGDPDWTRFYAEQSRTEIYDWVTEMGVTFVRAAPENSSGVRRFHFTEGRAVHLVLPIYRTALELPSVSFLWNAKVEHLVVEDGRVTGVVVRELRSGTTRTLHARHVVLATGGMESNLKRVLANWMPDLPKPDRLLIGSSIFSAQGSGQDLAREADAELDHLDRQYIYVNGLPDPRDPDKVHALTAGNDDSLWVNTAGQRFTDEVGPDKQILVDLLAQHPAHYWAIFDARTREDFGVRGAAWLKNPGDQNPILGNPAAAKQGASLAELATATGLPPAALEASVARFNALIEQGRDEDFGRWQTPDEAPPKIEQPPFYAVELYPMTRKSMGGVVIDRQGRALKPDGTPIEGLYAVGELNGSVGINGKHGMDGMFLGPAILTGRLAGETIARAHAAGGPIDLAPPPAEDPPPDPTSFSELTADDLRALLATSRDGYWHFQKAHGIVLERGYECSRCHSAALPFRFVNNRETRLAQTAVCTNCH